MGTDFKLGISDKAKPIIAGWIGVDNKAKPIITGLVGVNSKAKLFYSSNVGTPPYSKVFPDGTLGWYNGSNNIVKYEVYRRTASSSTYTLDGTYNLASRTVFVKDRTYDYKHTFTSSNFNRQNCYMYKIVCYNNNDREICVDGPHYVPWVGFEFDQTYLNYNGTIYYLSGATTSSTESVYGVQRYGYKYSGWYTGTGGTGIKYRDSMFVSVGNSSYNMETDKYYNSDATYKGNYYDIIKLYPAFNANHWLVDLSIGNGILVDSNNTEYSDQVLRVYVDKDQNTLGTCKIKANNLSLNSLTPSDYVSGGYRYTFKKWANRNGTEYTSSSTISSDFLDGTNPLTAIYNSALILTTPTITSMDLTDNTHSTSTSTSHSANNVYIYFKSPTDGDLSYIITTKYQQNGTEYTGNMINTSLYNNYSYSLKLNSIDVTTSQVGIRAVDTSGNQQEVKITMQWYKILVSVNGGNESNPNITYRFQAYYPINSGENLGDLINFSPTRSGYAFKGWYIYKNGFTSKRVYTYTTMDELDSSSYYTTDSTYTYLRDVSIYAKWEQTTYTVTIYRNGADTIGFYRGYVVDDSSTEYKTYEVPAGTALSVIMPSSASRSADSNYTYTFNNSGLSTSSTATSPNYSSSYSIDRNLTLYVVWTKTAAVQYRSLWVNKCNTNESVHFTSVTYKTGTGYDGGETTGDSGYYTYSNVPTNGTLKYSKFLPTSYTCPSGYTLSGWYDKNSGNNVTANQYITDTGSSMDIYPVFSGSGSSGGNSNLTITITSISDKRVNYTYTGNVVKIEAYKVNSSNYMYEKTQTSPSTGYIEFGNTSNMEKGVFLVAYEGTANKSGAAVSSKSGQTQFTSGTIKYIDSSSWIAGIGLSVDITFSASTNYLDLNGGSTYWASKGTGVTSLIPTLYV